MRNRYYDLNTYFRKQFGCRVQKITVDAGMTCPNRDGTLSSEGCIFCNSRGSGTGARARGLSIARQLAEGKTRLARRYKAKRFIAYFQSFSNTYGDPEDLAALYAEALGVPDVVGLSIGTRPDCVTPPILDLLGSLAQDSLIWLEYGLQSVHDATLALINRHHSFACFAQAVTGARKHGLNVCAHVILGLPGETAEDMLETARILGGMDIQGVKIHLLYVVRGTRLETLYRQGHYRCLSQEAYAQLVCRFLELLSPKMVVQRLTGDPHPEELIAPSWSLRKMETLKMIKNNLEREDSWQGKRWRG